MAFDNSVSADSLDVSSKVFNSAGKRKFKNTQSIATSETAINLGGITNIGAWMIRNLDQTNYVELKVGTAGAIRDKLDPDTTGVGKGGFACGTCMGSGSQVPYAIAHTAECNIEVIIIEL
jgi:hypothetical protein